MKLTKLLEPIKIGNLELKNRMIVPPMGTNYANPDGSVSQQLIDYYTARAKGGYGLIIQEVSAVKPNGKAIIFQVGIWDDSQIPGLKKLTDSVHAAGGKIIVQLHHAGRQTAPPFIGGETPVSASAVPCPADNCVVRELTSDEVWDMVHAYGDAAVRAKKAGYDGVEIHGAHGYLIAQFMSAHSNKRTDEWGGDLSGRLKFPAEIFKDVRAKVGPDFPMSFRFSYEECLVSGRNIEESTVTARVAEECGVDVLNVSICSYGSMEYMSATPHLPPGFNQHPTAIIKETVSIPVITVGRYSDLWVAEDVLRAGRADLIAFGRTSIADPEMPNKVAEGRQEEQNFCISCSQGCSGSLLNAARGFKMGCLMNPCVGHEWEYDMTPVPADQQKKVVIVGGGPAGLMAAKTAAIRGHKVALYEASDHLGGQFRLAAVPPGKQDIATGIKSLINACRMLGVEINLCAPVDEAVLKAAAPDAVILATGSKPLLPNIPGIDNEKFIPANDILAGKVIPGARVLIAGGGLVGCEVADFLCERSRAVTIVEMKPMIAPDAGATERRFMMKRLNSWQSAIDNFGPSLNVVTMATITEFFDDGVSAEQLGQKIDLRSYDTVILALGVQSYNPLEEAANAICGQVISVGDADKASDALYATESAFAAAMTL